VNDGGKVRNDSPELLLNITQQEHRAACLQLPNSLRHESHTHTQEEEEEEKEKEIPFFKSFTSGKPSQQCGLAWEGS